jgi:hypothetical protein
MGKQPGAVLYPKGILAYFFKSSSCDQVTARLSFWLPKSDYTPLVVIISGVNNTGCDISIDFFRSVIPKGILSYTTSRAVTMFRSQHFAFIYLMSFIRFALQLDLAETQFLSRG